MKKPVKDVIEPTINSQSTTEADVIWDEIKDVDLEVFALKNQFVSKYFEKLAVPGAVCLIKQVGPAACLPALEDRLLNKFDITVNDQGYLILSRKS